MTYDISLYPRRPGQVWEEAIAADEADGPPMDDAQLEAGVATFRRIEGRLREQLTEPVEVWVAEEADGDVLGELTGTDTGLQVELYDRSASISFPVRERAREARVALHDAVRRAVRVVGEETGYEAYDPQTRRGFDGLMEEDGLEPDVIPPGEGYAEPPGAEDPPVGATAGIDGGAGGASDAGQSPGLGAGATGPGDGVAEVAPDKTAEAFQRMDPGMLRRRSVLYLVLGALMAVFGFWRFATGDTTWLTWLVIGFAVFNLLGGVMMRSLSQQAQARKDAAAGPTEV